jgi:hypothetical protein
MMIMVRDEGITAVCHGCQGRAPSAMADGKRPVGWYGLTVQVPEGYSGRARDYIWVGLWCSIACLAASIPSLTAQEAAARTTYEAAPAAGGRR